MKKIAVPLALAFVLINAAAEAQKVDQERVDKELTLAGHNFVIDDVTHQRFLVGNVTNNSASKTCDPTISVNYLDANGNPINHKSAGTTALQPGGVWNFKLKAFDPQVTNYEILSLRGKWY